MRARVPSPAVKRTLGDAYFVSYSYLFHDTKGYAEIFNPDWRAFQIAFDIRGDAKPCDIEIPDDSALYWRLKGV